LTEFLTNPEQGIELNNPQETVNNELAAQRMLLKMAEEKGK